MLNFAAHFESSDDSRPVREPNLSKTERATSTFHPSTYRPTTIPPFKADSKIAIPRDSNNIVLNFNGREVKLTNLHKPFWPKLGLTKGDLLQYYADVANVLLPHVHDRAMVMKRYPNGASGDFFFMKRAPSPKPEWIETCSIEHSSGNVIDFPIVQDLPSLLWLINLGCIDLNQWYARCDDVDRPDYMHFDLDPGEGASFKKVLQVALLLREVLVKLNMPCFAKTSGGKGIHVYVPIVRGPIQKQVWTVAKGIARVLEQKKPKLITTVYTVSNRPRDHVLVDYNQNAWGRTLASIYSVRPTTKATVSTPVEWDEVERGLKIEDFRMDNVRSRIDKFGDLWKPLLSATGRFDLQRYT
jgi:bifunctional non-homologous end joining protein LigD